MISITSHAKKYAGKFLFATVATLDVKVRLLREDLLKLFFQSAAIIHGHCVFAALRSLFIGWVIRSKTYKYRVTLELQHVCRWKTRTS